MATQSSTAKQFANEMEVESRPRMTSVTAHMVTSIAVQMSIAEMETLISSFGKPQYDLTEMEMAIYQEFANAVHSLR